MSRKTPLTSWIKTALRKAAAMRIRIRRRRRDRNVEEQAPLRAELFSADQMEQHGKSLAASHVLNGSGKRDRLLQRLGDNQQVLDGTCDLLTSAVKAKQRIAPAGEWLLDNFHLIEEQIRTARQHLPKAYSRELPLLANGPSKGLPRVYDLALESISHGDGRVDAEALSRFVAAYQTVAPLALGELWAIPIMLRLALIENLRRVGARITAARLHLNQAQDWADRMMEVAERDPKSLILVIADMARSTPPMVSPFVAELARRLQGHGPSLALPLTWIEQRLAESSRTIEQLVLLETQQQAADQVSISNSIGSLRFLGAMDWRLFVESMSEVEQILLEDHDSIYRNMDFATRDRYRHVVDRLAKHSHCDEADIARSAIALTQQDGEVPVHHRHVGYFLIDQGLAQLESKIAARPSLIERLRRGIARSSLGQHLGAIALLSVLFAAGLCLLAGYERFDGAKRVVLIGLLLLASSQLASSLVNWLTTLLMTPQRLPRMDYSRGLPAEMRTLVVVPTLLGNAQDVDDLIEAIEVRFLGNQDPYLHFALLSDFADADTETTPADGPLLLQASVGIAQLNQKYVSSGKDRFLLFHRPRRWNAAEHIWMGYERKRGKLADLNAVLRGAAIGDRFSQVIGNPDALSSVRYVITLDTDTQLPRDTARQLVGAMAHPLNRPRYDAQRQRTCGGYGILQPRMAANLSDASRSRYSLLCGSEPGIDPYTRSVSDVYQDLFGEGSFIGKGIYEVDAFERALKDRFPENRILSHDLLEGCYARSGLLSDIDLFEAYPARHAADVKRQQRWIRGDWQIAIWLLPRVPGAQGWQRNPLSALSRWKILDNLRRSLVSTALLSLLLLGWFALEHATLWSLAILGVLLLPPTLVSLVDSLRKPPSAQWRPHLFAAAQAWRRSMALAGFRIAMLPYETQFSLGAILRTLWRMNVSRRGLLEWQVSQHGPARRVDGAAALVQTYRRLWIAPFMAMLTLFLLSLHRADALLAAVPVLLLWLTAPALSWWLSRPLLRRAVRLSSEQNQFLRRLSRKTWAFFERFVTDEDHNLPPDNYQEQPGPITAHRTSPTNIGMSLLANLSAYDFAYIQTNQLLERTAQTFRTMAQLPRHLGHFYNWYDTRSLQPLPPRYVSSVDSGNLAGHLLTLRAGLLGLADHKIVSPRLFEGLADTLGLIVGAAGDAHRARCSQLQAQLDAACMLRPHSLSAVMRFLEGVETTAARLSDDFGATGHPASADWAAALTTQCRHAMEDLRDLAPWLPLAEEAPEVCAQLGLVLRTESIPTLRELADALAQVVARVDARLHENSIAQEQDWLTALREQVRLGQLCAAARITSADQLAAQASAFACMEFEFLYDRNRHLLAIGYNVDEFRRDNSYYDLLASEARLASFVGIAQGQLPQESWFALSRLLTTVGGKPMLVSWSGSMFEYLMPMLVMPSYEGTLLDQTCRAAVATQIAHGQQRSLPWGVSESGYNTVDASLNYQYHAFGVPGLGLKRGLADDQVVAPYASALALMVFPEAACANLQRLSADGLEGPYGFYEAIDYTPSRLARNESSGSLKTDRSTRVPGTIVRSYMAHHQGMSLLSLAYLLLDRPMQRRFESDPRFQATLLLLQERVPKHAAVRSSGLDPETSAGYADASASWSTTPFGALTPSPEVQLLSNGRYHVMVSNAGGGYSRWKDLAITRWREDSTCDHWGAFIYLRDLDTGEFWSATHQPTCRRADSYEAMFSEGRAEVRRRDLDIETYSEIVVSPEDDIELRRVRLTNRSRQRRTIEITTYAEVVLAAPAADATQPSFGNLFVQTEIVAARHAILCTRRPRSISDPTPWMFHLLAANGNDVGEIAYETDRVRFLGRGRTARDPQAMQHGAQLSGSAGSVLDPIVAIRCRVQLDPEQSVTLDWVTGAAETREACLSLVDKYQDRHRADRVFDLAWTHSGVTLRQINASESDAQLYRRLAGSVLYANAGLRAESAVLIQNRRAQSGLWGFAISGDLPIVLLKIADSSHIDLARQLIQCHAYWRLKGLAVDLVIWNEDHAGYRQRLQDQIMGLIATGVEAHVIDRPGGIFVRSAEQISSEDRILLQAVARIILADSRGSLSEQVHRRAVAEQRVPRLALTRTRRAEPAATIAPPQADLILGNALGGFSANGREYVINTTSTQTTPLPWVNVLANAQFGTVISESGLSYTWSENAHEFRLTPWSDDPVGASGGEAFYLRDEESGHFWSPTPLPRHGAMPYRTRHGFGYSVFEHTSGGIRSELWVYVDRADAVKYSVLTVRNGSGRSRRLSATGYVEWVLGDLRPKTAMHVITEIDSSSGALFARNSYHSEFGGRVAFFDVDDAARTITGDRREFLGRNGSLRHPDAMLRSHLSGRVGAGFDPCGAIQVPFDLLDGEERQVIFRLGAAQDLEQTRKLALRLRQPGCARAALAGVRQYWARTLGTVQIDTPDAALNVLANGWLLYQTLACRMWARSGYYQSGGAYGFRDQLQDSMALLHAEPGLVREHLLRSAGRQYPQGDVQHWWHPPAGKGVRTRCSDDYLWLPYVACRYVHATADTGVLDETIHFLSGRPLGADEESYYDQPGRSEESASLYQHCVRAIQHGLRFGERGLPLMGSGDWNDGMNLVGIHGQGESVWLGFFLFEVLTAFADVARQHGDTGFSAQCLREAATLRSNLDQHAWDGEWYRRAWFDDGTPLGSSENTECAIDSIAQSWSVLSGAGEPGRTRIAMESLNRRLVRRGAGAGQGIVQLLDPPFDTSALNPGYIKGYVPGVRENGGQYTHAAIWAAMAFARLSDSERAWELLNLINPVNHGRSAQDLATYKTEPYVVAADVYAVAPHTGRGGWTWYTGSAGWLYRLILESLLGVKLDGACLRFSPCLPEHWSGFSMEYRYRETVYRILVRQTSASFGEDGIRIVLDGREQRDGLVELVDDQRAHEIEVDLQRAAHTKSPLMHSTTSTG